MTLILKATEFDKQAASFKKQYADEQALFKAGWLLQPKYDGVFAMIIVRSDRADCAILTRTGEPIRSCDHILDELHHHATRNAVYLGELWAHGIPFPEISGLARRHAPSPQLGVMLHDFLPLTLETPDPYLVRLAALRRALSTRSLLGPVDVVPLCVTVAESPHFDVQAYARELVAAGGYDGAMLKDPSAGYAIRVVRQGEIVKVKPTLSLDLQVVDRLVAEGEKTGRDVFTLVVVYRGVKTTVGSGVPHDINAVPRAGDIVEIECLGVTADGKLREPRFKGIKFDKTEGDQ